MKTSSKNTLVAFFSWSGNTRKIADQINKIVEGDLFEIQPVNDYSKNYSEVLERGKHEIRSGEKPALKEKPTSIKEYDVIFIGYPNWWSTFPAPILSFLSEYDFTGKTIVPFCTHGGGGIGRSVKEIAKLCRESKVLDGFSINGYAVNNNNPEVEEWLGSLQINV